MCCTLGHKRCFNLAGTMFLVPCLRPCRRPVWALTCSSYEARKQWPFCCAPGAVIRALHASHACPCVFGPMYVHSIASCAADAAAACLPVPAIKNSTIKKWAIYMREIRLHAGVRSALVNIQVDSERQLYGRSQLACLQLSSACCLSVCTHREFQHSRELPPVTQPQPFQLQTERRGRVHRARLQGKLQVGWSMGQGGVLLMCCSCATHFCCVLLFLILYPTPALLWCGPLCTATAPCIHL